MISGKGMHFEINGTDIDGCYRWSFRMSAQELDATDGSSGGFDEPETGVKSGTISGSGFYRVGTGAWTPVVAGTVATNVKLYPTSHATDVAVDAPTCVVTEFEITAEVKGRIEFTFTMKTKGSFTVSEVAA